MRESDKHLVIGDRKESAARRVTLLLATIARVALLLAIATA